VLNDAMTITRAGGSIGIPGLYVTEDPGAADEDAKHGALKMDFGLGWAKSHAFYTGQCPVMQYNRELMMSILTTRPRSPRPSTPRSCPWIEAPRATRTSTRARP
jgi:glutathione-independent formaldehyde dehydrogenase